jgi:5-formyltetrahydrofolate cyclo-ligase
MTTTKKTDIHKWYLHTIAPKDKIIQKRVLDLDEWKSASNVHLYRSLSDEVCTKLLTYDAYHISNKDIFFPATDVQYNPIDIDLVIVPGRSFDTNCNRKGRGGGYYDRFLSLLSVCKRSYYIGLAYDSQVKEHMVSNAWDVPVDMVVTETTLYKRR